MIPISDTIEPDFEVIEQPTRTYKLDLGMKAVSGFSEGLEAMRQAIFLILNTPRFVHEIYSWDYGSELGDLVGETKQFAYPEIKRRITEALTQDERILGVDSFEFRDNRGTVAVTFNVQTSEGNVQGETVVMV